MTDRHTYGHGNSMTDPAQRAESVKMGPSSQYVNEDLPTFKEYISDAVNYLELNSCHLLTSLVWLCCVAVNCYVVEFLLTVSAHKGPAHFLIFYTLSVLATDQ